jgi:addiction module RelE/StbE family toxin
MVEVKWTSQSLDDINNIAEFISRDSLKYANIQVQIFFDSVEILGAHPKSGRIVPEIKDPSIREIIVGFYRIIYQIQSKTLINIITFHHSKKLVRSKLFKK